MIPLLILLPILIGLIVFIVRSELMSLRKLSEDLDHQAAERPTRLPSHELPDEIIPFVEAINRLLARVDNMVSGQRRFISDAAHELRTPLAALSLQAQNLTQAKSSEETHQRLSSLQAGIERARKLTVQLLDLARLQAGEPSRVDVDIAMLARELIAEFHPMAEAKGIDLGLENLGLTNLRSDPAALRLILRNGLENAVKYTPDGGEVTLRLKNGSEGAGIEIIDTGPGIPTEEMEKVFNAFHRVSASSEGSGLGLAIAREASEKIGGQLSLSNRTDRSGLVLLFKQPIAA